MPNYCSECGRIGHALNNCRRRNVRPVDEGVNGASERPVNEGIDERVNLRRDMPTVCLNAPVCEKEFMQDDGALTGNMDTPIVCENVPMAKVRDEGNLEALNGNE